MVIHKYEVNNIVITNDNKRGIITALETSIVDNVHIPSYWVVYENSRYPDGFARNTWESSIIRKLEKHCITCKHNKCCFLALSCIPENYKHHETISSIKESSEM